MTTTQPAIDRTRPEHKVGAAKVAVNTLLSEALGPLSIAQRDELLTLRAILTAEPTGRVCSVYNTRDGRHCGAPAGESGRCERHERRTR